MEAKKLQQEELQQIKLLQEKNQIIISELGQIEIVKLNIESRIQIARAYLDELRKEEKTLADFLQSTYGEGTIDLDKGEFVPYT